MIFDIKVLSTPPEKAMPILFLGTVFEIYSKKNMRPFSIFSITATIVVILFNVLSYAQNDYHPGYIVLKSNDTLHGKIQDRNIQKGLLYEKIRFKSKKYKRKKYSAENLIAYKIGNTVFESKWIPK